MTGHGAVPYGFTEPLTGLWIIPADHATESYWVSLSLPNTVLYLVSYVARLHILTQGGACRG